VPVFLSGDRIKASFFYTPGGITSLGERIGGKGSVYLH
jgi:hypothetical protein